MLGESVGKGEHKMNKRLEKTGYIAFFLSGICAISSGIIVSVLQQKYGFSYGMTGTLLSFMSMEIWWLPFFPEFFQQELERRKRLVFYAVVTSWDIF